MERRRRELGRNKMLTLLLATVLQTKKKKLGKVNIRL